MIFKPFDMSDKVTGEANVVKAEHENLKTSSKELCQSEFQTVDSYKLSNVSNMMLMMVKVPV